MRVMGNFFVVEIRRNIYELNNTFFLQYIEYLPVQSIILNKQIHKQNERN